MALSQEAAEGVVHVYHSKTGAKTPPPRYSQLTIVTGPDISFETRFLVFMVRES